MLLDALMRSSIQGGIAILTLYLAFRAFPSVSPKVRLWLWRVIFLKLMLDLLPFAAITLRVLPQPSAAPALSTVETASASVSPAATVSNPLIVSPSPVLPASVESAPEGRAAIDPWALLYGVGVLTFAGRALYLAYAFKKQIEGATPVRDSALLSELRRLSLAAGRPTPPRLLESDQTSVALVTGVLKPLVLLPRGTVATDDTLLILAHEVAHLQHRDLEWSGFLLAVQTLFFFHPLVWLATRACRQAQESAADQAAIRLSSTTPRRYAEMLVRATVVHAPSMLSAASGMSVSGSAAGIQQRLRDMTHFTSKPTLARLALAVVLSAASAAMVPAYEFGQVAGQTSQTGNLAAKAGAKNRSDVKKKVAALRKATSQHKRNSAVKIANLSPSPATAFKVGSPYMKLGIEKLAPRKAQTSGGINLTFKNTDARSAFQVLSQAYQRSISVSSTVNGEVTLFAHGLTFEDVLKNMVAQLGATYSYQSGIYQVTGSVALSSSLGPAPRPITARTPKPGSDIIGVSCREADVRDMLGAVSKRVNLPIQVDPDVQGKVTLTLTNTTLDVVLENICMQVGATYQFENGGFRVFRNCVVSGNLDRVNATIVRADVRQALRSEFKLVNASYSIAPDVQGIVTLGLKNVTFETALSNTLRQVDATYRMDNGVFMIVRKSD